MKNNNNEKTDKIRETIILLLILIVALSVIVFMLKRTKMTSHIYSYDKGDDIKEKILLSAEGEKESEDKEDDKDTPDENTPPPVSPNPDDDSVFEEENPSFSPDTENEDGKDRGGTGHGN